MNRLQWMDLLRGVAILLVLLWHAPAIPVLFGQSMPEWIRTANEFFMPFRMQLLMFLSGMLLSRSLQRPIPEYLLGKLALLAWPYLVWAGIHIVQSGNMLSLTSARSWMATGYLWFLFFVGVYYCVAPFIQRIPAWIVSLGGFAASIPFDGELTKGIFYFLGFFYAGQFFAIHHGVVQWITHGWRLWACHLLALGVGIWSAVAGTGLKYEAITAPGSLAGILVAIAVAKRLPSTVLSRLVQGIGRRSIIYYVSHFPLIIVSSKLLLAIGVESVILHAMVGLLLALGAGHLLARMSSTAPVIWLFQLPGYSAIRRHVNVFNSSSAGNADTLKP